MSTVYLAASHGYDAEAIAGHVRAAAAALGVTLPHGGPAVLVPSCPWAHPLFAPTAATEPAVVDGVARALGAGSITIGAHSQPGFTTRYALRKAGYESLARRLGGRLVAFDEHPFRTLSRSAAATPSDGPIALPATWLNAPFRVLLPRLTGSVITPFAGVARLLFGLLPADVQLAELPRAVETGMAAGIAAPPSLIVVDAIEATHRGAELSGVPVELGVLIVGTDPEAVDLVAGVAYGLEPDAGAGRTGSPSLADVTIVGDLDLAELRLRARNVERLDPAPERYPLPGQVKVIRSERSSLAGVAGALTETFAVLARAGIGLAKARETTFVIGQVDGIPRGQSEQATIVFLGDSAAGDYAGYSRVIRLTGRTVPVSKVLMDVPYAMTVANLRTELGVEFALARVASRLARLFGGLRREPGPAGHTGSSGVMIDGP